MNICKDPLLCGRNIFLLTLNNNVASCPKTAKSFDSSGDCCFFLKIEYSRYMLWYVEMFRDVRDVQCIEVRTAQAKATTPWQISKTEPITELQSF